MAGVEFRAGEAIKSWAGIGKKLAVGTFLLVRDTSTDRRFADALSGVFND